MKAFPYKTYRKGQKEAINQARMAFEAGKRFVVIEAPTGSGKSAIAVTLARESNSAFILTAQKVLQDQYHQDYPDLAIMKGRSNYSCLVAPTNAANAPCIAGKKFPDCDDCPYFVAKDIAIAANSTIMNYAYYLAELNYSGGFGERKLLILDEAHNTESVLMSFIQISLSDSAFARVGIPEQIPSLLHDQEYFDYAEEAMSIIKGRSKEIDFQLKKDNLSAEFMLEQIQSKNYLDGQYKRLEMLLYSREENFSEWVVEKGRNKEGAWVKFKPVMVDSFAEDFIFSFADKVLMLSATILNPKTFLRSLGIEAEDAEIINVESDFPVENRPIYLKPVARMTRNYIDRDLPKLLLEISNIMDAHPNDKGLIHAHSYKNASYISQNLPARHKKRLVTHFSADSREAALAKHINSKSATVLLSPSMTEGIDLEGDLSRWQIIAKIPYPYLGDPQVQRRKSLDSSWYDWRTCLSIVQAYGRSVRSKDDFAITYILDADFPAFMKRQQRILPDWFLQAVVQDA